jgi:hypothetical protein
MAGMLDDVTEIACQLTRGEAYAQAIRQSTRARRSHGPAAPDTRTNGQ